MTTCTTRWQPGDRIPGTNRGEDRPAGLFDLDDHGTDCDGEVDGECPHEFTSALVPGLSFRWRPGDPVYPTPKKQADTPSDEPVTRPAQR